MIATEKCFLFFRKKLQNLHSGAICFFLCLKLNSTTNEPDDDETCFTSGTLLGQWLLSEPSYDLIQAHALVEHSFRDELNEDEEVRYAAYLTTQGLI